MDLSKLSLIFKIIIIGIIYIIIFFALRIMYKDIKNGGKKRVGNRRSFGLEVVSPGNNNNLRKGGVIPIQGEITIGRKGDNLLILDDPYVSGHHARVYIKNNDCFIEDLGSTNGTQLNNGIIKNREFLNAGDEITIGSTAFKVIG
jgi:hypothetical protein